MGHPEWITDERFVDWQHRQLHKEELYPLLEAYTKQYDKRLTQIINQYEGDGKLLI